MSTLAKAILIICTFISISCSKSNNAAGQPQSPSNNNPDTIGYSYLALGDSYTIGQSVSPEERFPTQAVALLKNDGIPVKAPQYIATTGWTTVNLINAISYENPPHNYDIVTLLIGVNDQYQHLDTPGYRLHFTQLLNTSISLAAGRKQRVIVLSIPDYSVTPFVSSGDKARVRKEINQFNAINKEITLQYDVAYIDITPLSRQAASDPSLIASDQLHFSGKEYAKWAALLAPKIKAALK